MTCRAYSFTLLINFLYTPSNFVLFNIPPIYLICIWPAFNLLHITILHSLSTAYTSMIPLCSETIFQCSLISTIILYSLVLIYTGLLHVNTFNYWHEKFKNYSILANYIMLFFFSFYWSTRWYVRPSVREQTVNTESMFWKQTYSTVFLTFFYYYYYHHCHNFTTTTASTTTSTSTSTASSSCATTTITTTTTISSSAITTISTTNILNLNLFMVFRHRAHENHACW